MTLETAKRLGYCDYRLSIMEVVNLPNPVSIFARRNLGARIKLTTSCRTFACSFVSWKITAKNWTYNSNEQSWGWCINFRFGLWKELWTAYCLVAAKWIYLELTWILLFVIPRYRSTCIRRFSPKIMQTIFRQKIQTNRDRLQLDIRISIIII